MNSKLKYWLLCSCFATTVNVVAEEAKTSETTPPKETPEATKPATSPESAATKPATPSDSAAATKPATPSDSVTTKANEAGKKLHEGNCVRCHLPEIYTRDTRKMKSYEGVKTQVQWCATQLSIPWFEEEVEQVASYINSEYYKFDTAEKSK